MRIAILLCDKFEEIRNSFSDMPTYDSIFRDMLNDVSEEEIFFETFYVKEMQYPKDISLYDKYIFTGSRAGAYEQIDWIVNLKEFVNKLFQAKKKMIGICFGHQLLAEALGGKVEKNSKGKSVGKRYSNLTNDYFAKYLTEKFAIEYHHGDCVVELPKNAKLLSYSDKCDIETFVIDDVVLSFQGHPEFKADFAEKMYLYSKNSYSESETKTYNENMSLRSDSKIIAKIILDF